MMRLPKDELENFDLHAWLSGGGDMGETFEKSRPERVYVEYTYYNNGESKSVGQNFKFCQ